MAERIKWMDAQGIDVQALSINPFWYGANRDVAEKLIRIQNEKLAEVVARESGSLRRLRDGRDAAS